MPLSVETSQIQNYTDITFKYGKKKLSKKDYGLRFKNECAIYENYLRRANPRFKKIYTTVHE